MSDDKKKESATDDAIAKAIKEGIVAGVQVAMQAKATPAAAAPVEPPVILDTGTCMECGQPIVRGKYACRQEHQTAVVLPNLNPKYFMGIKINGVNYVSPSGESVILPASVNVSGHLNAWDKKEQELMNGTKRNASAASRDFRHRQRE